MIEINFRLDEPTLLLNTWQRMHWSKRKSFSEALTWKMKAALQGLEPAEPMAACHIEVVRWSVQLPDWDGLYGGLKPYLDCLVRRTDRNPHGLGIIEDDNPLVIRSLMAEPIKAKKRVEQKTLFVIREVGGEGVSDAYVDIEDDQLDLVVKG